MQNTGAEKGFNVECSLKNNYFLYSISTQFQREFSFDGYITTLNKGLSRQEWVTGVKGIQREAVAPTRRLDSLISRILSSYYYILTERERMRDSMKSRLEFTYQTPGNTLK